MDFSKLKLNESVAVGSGANLAVAAETKTLKDAKNQKQMTNTSNNLGMQQNQMAQKQGNFKGATVQKTGGAPQQNAPQQVESYMQKLRDIKEQRKKIEASKSDWRAELKEAIGDDEVLHPYVEVMPMKSQKLDNIKKLMGKEVKNEKSDK